jgi:ubiquinone/menaquinone biosynthesis C-methylase UbiE
MMVPRRGESDIGRVADRGSSRLRRHAARLRDFGLEYEALASARGLADRLSRLLAEAGDGIEARLLTIEGERGVLGPAHRAYTGHSADRNRDVWTGWDWSARGNEWNDGADPAAWKASLISDVLIETIPEGGVVLEIGPGGGRWSDVLQARADRLLLVDVTERALELCRERFAGAPNVEYILTERATLPGVRDGFVDSVWSFDVFVHVAPVDVASYLAEIARVLRPGGIAVIHHSGRFSRSSGWRSPMTPQLFANLSRERGLVVERQFDSWAGGRFGVRTNGDVITLLRAPADAPETG